MPASLAPVGAGTLANNNNGTFDFTPAPNFNGNATFSYTVDDSNGATSNPATVTITVTPVNDAPTFTVATDPITVLEDSGVYSAAWASASSGGPGETQGLTFVVTDNTNPTLFAAGPGVSATGVLGFTPASNANGTATITIELRDDGGTANGGTDTSAPVVFDIVVTAVNDAPSFTKGSDVTVGEDSGAYTEAGWATALSVGPANEAAAPPQTPLTFSVVPANSGLFSAGPTISDTGELTFTPASNANGSTLVTVTLQDSAGTANSGVDTSPAQTFRITVTSVNDVPVAVADGGLTTPITSKRTKRSTVPPQPDARANDTDVEDSSPPPVTSPS